MYDKIQEAPDQSIKNVLSKLLALYGLHSIDKQHVSVLYQGGYTSGDKPVNLIQNAILQLCAEIKGDAVSLVDVIALPDFLLNSVLGAADGQVIRYLLLFYHFVFGRLIQKILFRQLYLSCNVASITYRFFMIFSLNTANRIRFSIYNFFMDLNSN